jgi:neutral ceramidase
LASRGLARTLEIEYRSADCAHAVRCLIRIMPARIGYQSLSVVLCFLIGCAASAATFRAAVTKVDITPETSQWLMGYDPRQSTGIHDKIYHRILALDDGKTRFYLIASDLCLFSPSVYDVVATRLDREFGIKRENFWWTVTHTHAAPEVGPPAIYRSLLGRSTHEWNRDYEQQVTTALVQGVQQLTAKLEPARIAIGLGISMANINRRAKDVDGTVTLGLNPDGPVDRQIGLMSIGRPDGTPIAIVANYAMHGTVLSGANLQIGGDAPGVVESYVEDKIGAPTLYINGAAGNIAPIYSVYPDPDRGHLSQFRVLLGDQILAALKSSLGPPVDTVRMHAAELIVETPAKQGLSWPAELAAYSKHTSSGRPLLRLPIRVLIVNDALIWSAPVELFCEIAIAVRQQSRFAHTFYFGYANGWLGYLPTAQAFAEGGYEPKTSPFTEAVEQDLLTSVLTYIQGIPR